MPTYDAAPGLELERARAPSPQARSRGWLFPDQPDSGSSRAPLPVPMWPGYIAARGRMPIHEIPSDASFLEFWCRSFDCKRVLRDQPQRHDQSRERYERVEQRDWKINEKLEGPPRQHDGADRPEQSWERRLLVQLADPASDRCPEVYSCVWIGESLKLAGHGLEVPQPTAARRTVQKMLLVSGRSRIALSVV